ncbi:acetyl-CoA carboxylase biotin carboxyl carrier protein subunit [Roseobacter litoralis]|uniref:acetyl-CoA carboxylase biotin carboxyl carrier protein subunit n=1 Tax=Roseobacter litoralis TaxID=42443 RepID=UPI0024955BA1|nr:biotin/lipoyl-containing protein [Roseobacter litoralis]
MRRIFQIDGDETECWLSHDGSRFILNTPGGAFPCQLDPTGVPGDYVLRANGHVQNVRLAVGPDTTFVHLNGRTYAIGRVDPAERLAGSDGGAADDRIVAPMPGVVVAVHVKPGDHVEEGQPLLVIESMKLETSLAASRDGVVAEIPFAEGDSFGLKATLALLAPEED